MERRARALGSALPLEQGNYYYYCNYYYCWVTSTSQANGREEAAPSKQPPPSTPNSEAGTLTYEERAYI